MGKDDVRLMSADEYFKHKDIRDSQEGWKVTPKVWCVLAGILLVISAILSFKYGTIFVTFWDTESLASLMCWLTFQIVFTLPAIVGAVSAFTQRKFQFAMAGAALSIGVTIILGVITLIFLYWGVDEFGKYEGTLE